MTLTPFRVQYRFQGKLENGSKVDIGQGDALADKESVAREMLIQDV